MWAEPFVVIILVNFNHADVTLECLKSLKKITYRNVRIVIVDNASADESTEVLQKANSNKAYKLIYMEENQGFAAGCNAGIQYAMEQNAQYVLLLNNDTVVDARFLTELINHMKIHPECGAAIGTIFYDQRRDIIWYAGGSLNPRTGRIVHDQFGQQGTKTVGDSPRNISFATGCCLCLKMDTIQAIGLLDKDYFMYEEDADYCLRILQQGKRIHYVPSAVIYHKLSISAGASSPMIQYYSARNHLLMIKKNFRGINRWIAEAVTFLVLLKRCATGEWSFTHVVHGVIAYYRGEKGKHIQGENLPMKVLLLDQIAQVNYKYTFSLVNALKACGNEITLVIDDLEDISYCQCKCERRFLTARKDIGKIKKLLNYVKAYQYVTRTVADGNFDIVHTQWFSFSPLDYLYLQKLKKHGIRLVVTVHDILPFNQRIYDMLFHRKIYGLSDWIIVQAEGNLKRFATLFPENAKKAVCIPHGHFLQFTKQYNQQEARKHLNIPSDKTVLLFFGQIKKAKGLGVLLEAYGKVSHKRDDLFLVVAGNVWKDDFTLYQKIIAEQQLIKAQLLLDIRFIPDHELGYYYSSCDVAVLPYLDVYQSGVIQLAYAYDKPVIATELAPFLEIVVDGETGYLCKPNNTDSLAEAIERAADALEDLPVLGKNGCRKIAKQFSWDEIAHKITALYHK